LIDTGDSLYIGGKFSHVAGKDGTHVFSNVNNIMRFRTDIESITPTTDQILNYTVKAMLVTSVIAPDSL